MRPWLEIDGSIPNKLGKCNAIRSRCYPLACSTSMRSEDSEGHALSSTCRERTETVPKTWRKQPWPAERQPKQLEARSLFS